MRVPLLEADLAQKRGKCKLDRTMAAIYCATVHYFINT